MMGMPSRYNSEVLGTNKEYAFSKQQDDLWNTLVQTQFIYDRDFMNIVLAELNE